MPVSGTDRRVLVRTVIATLACLGGLLLAAVPTVARAEDETHKLVIIAGRPSHPPRMHEFNAGVQLLAKCLREAEIPNFEVEFVLNGWPEDESVFEGADAVLFYMDGGGGHEVVKQFPRRLELVQEWADQ